MLRRCTLVGANFGFPVKSLNHNSRSIRTIHYHRIVQRRIQKLNNQDNTKIEWIISIHSVPAMLIKYFPEVWLRSWIVCKTNVNKAHYIWTIKTFLSQDRIIARLLRHSSLHYCSKPRSKILHHRLKMTVHRGTMDPVWYFAHAWIARQHMTAPLARVRVRARRSLDDRW